MKSYKIFILTSILSLPLCITAHADDLKVYSPKIEEGERAVEANLNMDFDHRDDKNHYVSQVIGGEYAPTAYWKPRSAVKSKKNHMTATSLQILNGKTLFLPGKPVKI